MYTARKGCRRCGTLVYMYVCVCVYTCRHVEMYIRKLYMQICMTKETYYMTK